MKKEKLRYGMVGGGTGAFIGAVHRKAIALNENASLVAACFSENEERNVSTGKRFEIAEERIYKNYKEMAEKEAKRKDKIDFVSIVTPNALHYKIAMAFLDAGIHVACEKPLCLTLEEAEDLQRKAREKKLCVCVTYTYTGYPMVKLARELIQQGEIGEIVNINAEYLQEWLMDELYLHKSSGKTLSLWRTDPQKAGISNCVGDIGSHIEATVSYITGLYPKRISAVLDHYGADLDLNANILVEFSNGAHGVFCCSQVCAGHQNDFVIRIFGTKGAIEWIQERPEFLKVARKDKPIQIYDRGTGYITGKAAELNHLPAGHPEGIILAFSNIYQSFCDALLEIKNRKKFLKEEMDFPDLNDGIRGVKFIHAAVESKKNDSKWVAL